MLLCWWWGWECGLVVMPGVAREPPIHPHAGLGAGTLGGGAGAGRAVSPQVWEVLGSLAAPLFLQPRTATGSLSAPASLETVCWRMCSRPQAG